MDPDDVEQIVDFLAEVARLRRDLDGIEYQAVKLARTFGASWEDIGEGLGISRQAATGRFSKPRKRRLTI